MGDRRIFVVLLGIVLLLVIPFSVNATVFADDDDDDDDKKYKYDDDDDDDYKKKYKKNTTKVIHLGFLQLAAHDFFNVSRCLDPSVPLVHPFEPLVTIPGCEIKDSENGKLDASTVLFNPKGDMCDYKKSIDPAVLECSLYSEDEIRNGGEFRSTENIMILTAGALVGEKYLKYADKHGEEKAYKKTLKYYHKQLKKAYEESFHLKFPKPKAGELTDLHNLAVRTGHDFLPAEIVYKGKVTSLFDDKLDGKKLNKKEQKQKSSPLDGKLDGAFLDIVVFCPNPDAHPSFCITVNLLAADQSFGKQFGLMPPDMDEDTFDDLMDELKDGKFNKKDKVSKLLKEAYSRGLYLAPSADEPSKIEICHKDKKTKTIPEDKLSKHLAHGDELGPCDDDDDDD